MIKVQKEDFDVNKELKKWAKDNDDEINTIEGRKKKIQSLTKKGIKKFK